MTELQDRWTCIYLTSSDMILLMTNAIRKIIESY